MHAFIVNHIDMNSKIFVVFAIFLAVVAAKQIPFSHPEGRIVGGEVVEPHSLPFQVFLQTRTPQGTALCGGSLISPEWVLSAAHCVDFEGVGDFNTTVILGAHNITYDEPEQQQIQSDQVIIHELWNATLARNDVSLIHLSTPAFLNEFVQDAPLASVEPAVNDTVTLSGWGLLTDEDETVTDVLRSVDVTVISDEECRRTFLVIPDYDQMICTSGEGQVGACNGDSGGPMSQDGVVSGIASFVSGLGCDAGRATAYVSVPYHLEWITEHSGVSPPQ